MPAVGSSSSSSVGSVASASADLELAAVAVGQRCRLDAAFVGQPDPREQLVGARVDVAHATCGDDRLACASEGALQRRRRRSRARVIPSKRLECWNVRPIPSRVRRCGPRRVMSPAVEADAAARRLDGARDQAEQRRLARAVRADERLPRPCSDRQRHAVDRAAARRSGGRQPSSSSIAVIVRASRAASGCRRRCRPAAGRRRARTSPRGRAASGTRARPKAGRAGRSRRRRRARRRRASAGRR